MTDVFSKDKRSEIMGRIRGKDTGPEIIVRKQLFALGFRYRIHDKKLPGRPDIVLPGYRSVVIVNGCFWHGHRNCKVFKMPKIRQGFWRMKIERNRQRDVRVSKALRRAGWRVITVWECQLRKSRLESTMNRIILRILGCS